MTETMLNWEDLTKQADQNGSTPLHIAASLWGVGGGYHWTFCRTFPWVLGKWRSSFPIKTLLRADPYQLYQPDREGSFPIHIAAASGLYSTVEAMIAESPAIAGLQDSKGRTFLHVAVELKRGHLIANACHTPSLEWILNMKDNDGNTALHLAVKLGVPDIFFSLLMNKTICLNLMNNNWETPLDLLTLSKTTPAGHSDGWNNDGDLISAALRHCQARRGPQSRYDQLIKAQEYFAKQKQEDEVNQSNKLTDSTETPIILPALILAATYVTFFTVPARYNNRGAPVPAGTYVFNAFMMANAIAFLSSAAATLRLLDSAGMAMHRIQQQHLDISAYCAFCAVTCFCATFALGQFLILAPAAHMAATATCALVFLVFLVSWFGYTQPRGGFIGFARALRARLGSGKAFLICARIVLWPMLAVCWPFVVIFGSAALSAE